MIAPIPALYYAHKVLNGLLTNYLVLVWLTNKINELFCLLSIPMAYTYTETRLV